MINKIINYIILSGLVFFSHTVIAQDEIIIEYVSINTSEKEYAPVYYKNGIVFCGVNTNNEALTYIDDETGKQLTDIYFSSLVDGELQEKELFSSELKTSFHDGPITFSDDGNTAYFTRSELVSKKLKNSTKVQNMLGVYKTTFDGEKWGNVTSCYFNSKEYNVGQPSLSADGKRLYVVSDKPNGFGGIDIYYAEIVDGFCGSLVNLGDKINSESNEMFPFIDPNNKLYFSSDRESKFGGLDIYISKLIDKKWNDSYIMDSTINSQYDDFAIIFNKDETEGFFSSNRAGSDDIYKISVKYPDFNDCEELISELLCYEFFEEATLNVDSVAMIYEWDFGDGIKERALETYHCYETAGFYIVELNIMDPMMSKTFVNEATYELEIEEVFQPEIICPDTISMNTAFNVKVNQGKWEQFQIANYYIDYGDSTVIKNDRNTHAYSTDGFKDLKILISGHDKDIDDISTSCFYKKIFVTSDTTSLAIQDKFIEDLNYAGFNSDKINEHDANEDYYSLEILKSSTSVLNDTNQLKEFMNRVTEVFDSSSNSYSYVLGKTKNPFDMIDEFRLAHKAGFDNAIVKSFKNESINISDLGMVYDNESGEINIVLNNIHFEFNGYELDEKSKVELEGLIQYLKNDNEIKIEIGAHTDNIGNGAYNLKLSQKRAKSVIKYISKQGVDIKRLQAKGYGKSEPIAPNNLPDGSDNPDGRAKNRRVTFKILVGE